MEEPLLNGENGIRDELGRFVEGHPGGPGRPPYKVSITNAQQKYYHEHPEEFEKFCEEMRKDPTMRKTFWAYFDGLPKESIQHSGGVQVVSIPAALIENVEPNTSAESNSSGQASV